MYTLSTLSAPSATPLASCNTHPQMEPDPNALRHGAFSSPWHRQGVSKQGYKIYDDLRYVFWFWGLLDRGTGLRPVVFQVCVCVCLFGLSLWFVSSVQPCEPETILSLASPPLASETETDSTDSTVHSMGPYLSPRNWTARPHKLCEPSPEARLRLLYSCVAGYLAW